MASWRIGRPTLVWGNQSLPIASKVPGESSAQLAAEDLEEHTQREHAGDQDKHVAEHLEQAERRGEHRAGQTGQEHRSHDAERAGQERDGSKVDELPKDVTVTAVGKQPDVDAQAAISQ